jgi:hypothetical protein
VDGFPTPRLFLATTSTWYAVPGDKPLSVTDLPEPFTTRLDTWQPLAWNAQWAKRTV